MNLIDELALRAKERLPERIHSAISRGVGDSVAFDGNLQAWRDIKIAPHVLSGVGMADTATTVLGTRVSTPVLLAPAGLPRGANQEGECAAARGAHAARTLMVLSHHSTRTLEEVAAAAPECARWFQLYVTTDHAHCESLLRRAGATGYGAIVLTVDSGGGIALEGQAPDPDWDLTPMRGEGDLDPSISVDRIAWAKQHSGLPVVVKGVMRADDARRCVDAGADAIIVSNHGGRALDSAAATAQALPYVAEAVGDRVEVYVDGGIRHGQDVIKAIALGARAVFIGQPWVWAVCAGGADEVVAVVRVMTAELVAGLAMCGLASLEAVDERILWIGGADFLDSRR
jgi:4-hydroxymandelate oxidase